MNTPFAQQLLLASLGVGAWSALGLLLAWLARRDAGARHRLLRSFCVLALLAWPAQWGVMEAAARWNWRPFESGLLRGTAASWERWRPYFFSGAEEAAAGTFSPPSLPDAGHAKSLGAPALNRRTSTVGTALPFVYAAGAGGVLLLWALRYGKTRRLLRNCRPSENAEIIALWKDVSAAVGLRRNARLLECDGLRTPACCGWLRPMVILPALPLAALDRSAWRCALHHEALHLRRRDPLIADLQTLLRVLFWFHPLIWLLNRELDRQRELSCDALTARATRKPRTYALALLAFHEPEPFCAVPGLAGGLPFGGRDARLTLKRRLEMLTHAQTEMTARRRRLLAGALAAGAAAVGAAHFSLAAAFAPAPPAAFAQDAAPKNPVNIRMADTKPNEPKRAEADAPPGERDGRHLLEQFRHFGRPLSGTCTDQETVASAAKGNVRNGVLEAEEILLLSLPEGSQLRATFEGRNLAMQQAGDATNLTLQDGVVRISDAAGVVRLTARPAADRGILQIAAEIKNGEVALTLRSAAENNQAQRIHLEMNLNAGVPAGEKQPPHGAVRWQFNAGGEGKPSRVKMQWIYEMEQLKRAAEGRENQGGAVRP